ncbi:AmmeMemoRadiSam system radical SAM enzyme [Candidatus Pacearchaeota archaeon]|nr:AmmeMemoRadiSam system radical SAM enzyme [Candidatus Pacearchaeota archaeon]
MQEKLKEALYYKKLKGGIVQCQLCPKFCTIKNGERGNCGVRENQNGTLYSLVYAKACSANLDPIEKKPFYHFMPGEQVMSLATVGCNLHCKQCQNWQISQVRVEYYPSISLTPEEVVEKTMEAECKIIAYTYTEPTVFYEYMLDIAKLARKQGIKNVIVSNGFINPEPLKELCKYIDAANIDLKSITDKFYGQVCDGSLQPILKAIEILHENKIWTEITNLIIPGFNDKESEIKGLVQWVKDLGRSMPLHFSAFSPTYKLVQCSPTPKEALIKARQIALKAGLKHVYTGNVDNEEGSTTFCPKCKKPLIVRQGNYVFKNLIEKGKCKFCNEKIAGVWE